MSGFLSFPRDRASEVARAYRSYMANAPDRVGGGLLLGAGLGGALAGGPGEMALEVPDADWAYECVGLFDRTRLR